MNMLLDTLPNYVYGRTVLLALLLVGLTACSTGDDEDDLLGNWVRRSDFEGVPRSNAVAFTLGNYAYVGLGYDGDEDLRDFWRYDPALDFWTRTDTFPGQARRAAVAFSVAGKGYVGTGFNGEDDQELADFYVFDPAAPDGSHWSRIEDFPGSARYNAVAFADENFGYVGTGYDGNWLKDVYAYDPALGLWEQQVSLGGSKRENAIAFSIEGDHFICTGRNNGLNEFDAWRYQPAGGLWSRLQDLDEDDDYNIARYGAVAFTMNGFGYITTGTNGFNVNSVWEYDPATDEWLEKNGFEGVSRRDAIAFEINGRAFVGLGTNGGTRLDDLREFFPDEELDEDD